MKTIYKYSLGATEKQLIIMPEKALILTVQMQGNIPCLWALVDTDNVSITENIIVVGTGLPVPEETMDYIGTFQLMDGALVFHVFREIQ